MENKEITNIQKLTAEDKERLINELNQNEDFIKLNNELNQKGYEKQNTEFLLEENKTKIKVNYNNSINQTPYISAEVIDEKIKDVKIENLEDEFSNNYYWLIYILIGIVLVIVSGYLIYYKYFKKNKKIGLDTQVIDNDKPFDYKYEARKLLGQAKELFESDKYKDAYEKAGQAIRLYLSYKYDLKKETTNDEIIRYLKNKKMDFSKIKECFDLCCLVEFAKYKANKNDFDDILKIGERIIG